jgi:hypothetical protein
MKSLKNFALFCVSCLVSLNIVMPAYSGNPEPAFTLEQLIQRALSRSDIISSKKEFIEEIRWAKRQAVSWKNPSLSLQGGSKQAENKTGYLYSISISQPFIFPGKTGLIEDIYSSDEKIAGLSLEETQLFIRYEVIRLTYVYKIAESIEGHLRERVDRFKLIDEYMRNRPFVSPKKRMDRNIVQSRLLILQKGLSELQSEKDIVWSRLNLYIDFPEKINMYADWFKKGPVMDRGTIITSAIERNFELRKQKIKLEKSRHEMRLAKKEVLPDFDLSAFYNQDKAAGVERSFGAGVTMYMPIVNRNKGAVKSLEARARAEKSEIEYKERHMRQDLNALYTGYNLASANLKRFPLSLIEKTHTQMNDADNEFRKGTIDFLTYLEAETQAYENHLAVFNSQREFIEKYISILMLAGSTEFKTGE